MEHEDKYERALSKQYMQDRITSLEGSLRYIHRMLHWHPYGVSQYHEEEWYQNIEKTIHSHLAEGEQ
jgi:hypothetical protein